MGTLCASRTSFSCTLLLFVGKNSLYNLPKVLTTVSRKYLMSLFRAVFLTDLDRHGVFKCPQGQVLREGYQPLREIGVDNPLEKLVLGSAWRRHDVLDLKQK